MKYGHFDDKNREYVITTPETPYPWINYLGTEDFFSLISNTAGGYAFTRMPNSGASPVTGTTMFPPMPGDAISISVTGKASGHRDGNP